MNEKELNENLKAELEKKAEISEEEIEDMETIGRDAKANRARQRKLSHDSEIDEEEEFRMDLENAEKKHRVKRKKKFLYNEMGMKIEPFGLKDEFQNGTLEKVGDDYL